LDLCRAWLYRKKDEARKWYDQAVEWMEKNKPEDEDSAASARKRKN
jgi:hypothetical protein